MIPAGPSLVFYLDTSALVKRYATEIGSSWVISLCDPASENTIATALITRAEAAAAFSRKLRDRELSESDYRAALQDLAHDSAHQYLLVEIDGALVNLAVELTKRQMLRGYDAVQLAAALILDDTLTQAGLFPLTFVAADDSLLTAAESEGLITDDPKAHP